MAVVIVSNTGGNYNATSTWVGGVVPTSADDVIFTATSGNLIVNVASVCKSIDFTNYVGTLDMSNTLTISGNVTLVSAMTITGSSTLIVNSTASLTSNGKTISCALSLVGVFTYTLVDNWTITGKLTLGTAANGLQTINGNIFYVGADFCINAANVLGTTNFIYNGTGIWLNVGTGYLRNNFTINTAGTLTFSGLIYYYTGVFTYVAGTTITTGSDFIIAGACTLNVNGSNVAGASTTSSTGINWWNFTNQSGAVTLTSDMCVINLFKIASSNFTGPYNIYINGSLNCTGTGNTYGTSTFIMNGTGTLSSAIGSFYITNSLTINTAGTITFGVFLGFAGGISLPSLTYIAGTTITEGNTTTITSTIKLDTKGLTTEDASTTSHTGINWNNLTLINGTITNSSVLCIVGTLNYNSTSVLNGSQVYVNGSFISTNNNTLGTSLIIMNGNGKLFLSTATLGNSLTINTRGIIIVSGVFSFRTATFTYIKGIVKSADLDKKILLEIAASCTLINIHKIPFTNVMINNGQTLTMNQFFSGTPYFPCKVYSNNGAVYNVKFTDTKEKLAKFVTVRNANIINRGQLMIITNYNTQVSGQSPNIGVRYNNQLPNGAPTNENSINNTYGYPFNGMISDPSMIRRN